LAPHPDLTAEQTYIDRAYRRLDAMRAAARSRLDSVLLERGGTPQAREERDVIVRSSLQRLEQLRIGNQALCFGRIDRAEAGREDERDERFYIGRLGVSGEDNEQLVVDWRAPVAEPFYRATGRDPMGLRRRRHFMSEGRRLLALEDELFAAADGEGEAADDEVVGPGALLAVLERSRSGHMRDIVATVQREQDEVIRAPLGGVLVVQGGPGTGKTAVALHRAAYLLYTHRFPLERQGVLVVGPNQVFLRYIEQVLPSLGEAGVALATVEGLAAGVPVRAEEDSRTAALKGEARMAEVIGQAVRDRQRPLPRVVSVPFGATLLELGPAESRRAVNAGRRRSGTHNGRRRAVEEAAAGILVGQYRRRRGRLGAPAPEDDQAVDDAELARQIRSQPAFAEALQRMWPRLLPEELLHDLYGSGPLLALAGRGVLADGEIEALKRPRSSSLETIPWTRADLALMDEARVLLGPVRSAEEGPRSYGHIVVDEAQDLSAMELRMLARRSISGSMTVVGDIAQATGPSAHRHWDEVVAHLPGRPPPRVVELSINYRTPAEVMALAARVLRATTPELDPPRSIRSTGSEPTETEARPAELASTVAAVAAGELEAIGDGTVAVIAPPSMLATLGEALRRAGLPAAEAGEAGLGSALTLIDIGLVKGLEFDSVVVVEPARLAGEAVQGLRALYVALSRPTRRLAMVHSEPLPEALGG
jgi:DNA helicase IV